MRATSIAVCCILLFILGVAGAESLTGARDDSPNSVTEPAPPIGMLEIPSATFSEGFADVSTLAARGWVQTNNSQPLGDTAWFQGNATVFPSQSGTENAYIAANFNNAGSDTNATISNWLILPPMVLRNGDEFAFWTKASNTGWGERLELRVSTSGESFDVGSSAESVGDFDTRLLVINEELADDKYPTSWTRYTLFLDGLAEGTVTKGRLAFRYYVTNGGRSGSNSNYIGLDTVSWFSYQPAIAVSSTVGMDPAVCGTSSSPALDIGSHYYVCHRLTNEGNVPLTSAGYSGPDGASGSITAELAVGATYEWITGPFTVEADTELDFSWTAGNPERNGDMLSAASSIQITAEPVITAVEVTPGQATLVPQDTVNLTATVSGVGDFDTTVTWSSSDESVATISGTGVVTAVNAGSAVMTATSNQDPTVSGTANIAVEEAVLSLAVTGNELPDISAAAGAQDLELISFTLAATGDSAISVSGFTFSAANLVFSVEPAADEELNRILELLSLDVAVSTVDSTAVLDGTDAVLTLAAPLVVEPGSPVTVVLRANATASLAGETAVVALAAAGLAALVLQHRRRQLAVVLLVLLLGLSACASQSTGADPEPDPVTVSFTAQLDAVASDAAAITGLPLHGADVTLTY